MRMRKRRGRGGRALVCVNDFIIEANVNDRSSRITHQRENLTN